MARAKLKGIVLKKCKGCNKVKKMSKHRVTCCSKCASKYRNSSERVAKYKK